MKIFPLLLAAFALSAGAQTVTLSSGSQSMTVNSGSTVTVTANPAVVTPPPVPAPAVTFGVTPASVVAGASASLSWTSANATTVTLNGASVALNGSESVAPTSTTTYTLIATNSVGVSVTATATLTVTQPVATSCKGTPISTAEVINGKAGITYCLQNNITGTIGIEGTATLDLNGFTITNSTGAAILGCSAGAEIYPAATATCPKGQTLPGKWTITNSAGNAVGGIVQVANAPVGIPAIYIGSENADGGYPPEANVNNLHIVLNGAAAQAIRYAYTAGGATIQNNVIDGSAMTSIQLANETPFSARARFGGYLVWIGGGNGPPLAADTLTQNTFIGAPQGGITDDMPKSSITYNICGMNSHYSNDYCVLSTVDSQTIENNSVTGQGRGIDVEGNGWVVDNNTINVFETNTNTEYNGCEDGGGYGIRAKFNPQDNTVGPSGVLASNVVTVSAKLCPALALEFTDVLESNSINFSTNNLTSIAGSGGYDAALGFSGTSTNLAGTGNTLTGTYGVYIGWSGANVNLLAGQTWNPATALVDNQNGGNDPPVAEDPDVPVPSPMQITIPDSPANSTVVWGSSASGTVTVGSKTTSN